MASKLRSKWQYIKEHRVVGIVLVLAIVFILIIYAGYRFSWEWTGFNAHIGPNVQQYQPARTLWDWLGVLAIPIVAGLGATWYTAQQGKVSARENADNQRETALQAYIDKMSELLLEKHLRESKEDDEIRTIVYVRTITLLPQLDARRIGYVFTFLHEAKLMSSDKSESNILSLSGADLHKVNWSTADINQANLSQANLGSADLSSAHLSEANLSSTYLRGANLSGANLGYADLSLANLTKANLSSTYLRRANLTNADLREANLSDADLREANLSDANLREAQNITPEQLAQAYTLRNAKLPDGSKYPSTSYPIPNHQEPTS